jgi:cell division septal protein FtsQ
MPGERRRPLPARAAVVPLRGRARPRGRRAPGLLRLAPSPRSLLIGAAILLLAAGTYAVARESSMFAIRRIEIRGADLRTEAAVRKALTPIKGKNLLALGGGDVARLADSLPYVVSVRYGRWFPHTLRVTVVEERAVAVLHRGNDRFLVSARARVIRPLAPNAFPNLPRIWVPHSTDVGLGETLAGDPGAAVVALVPLQRLHFPVRVATAQAAGGQLTLRLVTGLEVRLGDAQDLPLKLAIAGQIAPTVTPSAGAYLDLSVPERPVAGVKNSKVAGKG